MTVREAVRKIRGVDQCYLAWYGSLNAFDPDDEIMMDAYGKYAVEKIVFCSHEEKGKICSHVEIELAMRLVTEEATV